MEVRYSTQDTPNGCLRIENVVERPLQAVSYINRHTSLSRAIGSRSSKSPVKMIGMNIYFGI